MNSLVDPGHVKQAPSYVHLTRTTVLITEFTDTGVIYLHVVSLSSEAV
jgi:hypothetical protein